MLKDEIKLEAGELIDASYISKKKLCEFFEKEMTDCKVSGFFVILLENTKSFSTNGTLKKSEKMVYK